MLNKKYLLAALVTLAASSAAFAAYSPSHYVERSYFANADLTSYVGSSTQFCSGTFYSSGTTSQYYSELKIPCNKPL